MTSAATHVLPAGVRITGLVPHRDERGEFTEVYRREWDTGIAPVRWNAVRSRATVLRGVHVHPRHDDYLLAYEGEASIGLRDLREASPTAGLATCVEMRGASPFALTIPHGVAHGFYFHTDAIHFYAVSHYRDPEDELGCRWDDPELEIPWPIKRALISARDEALPSLRELQRELRTRASS